MLYTWSSLVGASTIGVVYQRVGLLGPLVEPAGVFCFDHMHQLGCTSMLSRVEYLHGPIGLTLMSGYIHTIGVGAPTPFSGGGGGCFACGWRWWMSGLVICVHPCLINCIMKSQCWFLEVSGCGLGSA